jgi:uncharacterized membrane protein YdbT with pleckstrin-like domain
VKVDPGERVIYQGHPSWRGILSFYLKGVLLSIAAALIVWLLTGLFGDSENGLASGILIAGVVLTVLVGFIRRVATVYTITDRRLHIKRGIIARHTQETQIHRAQNVNTHQSVIDRMLQVGTVNFDTAGSGDYDFAFVGVSDPEDVVRAVDEVQHQGQRQTAPSDQL